MTQNKNKTVLTTIGIDHSTNRQIDKLCKRYNLKKKRDREARFRVYG